MSVVTNSIGAEGLNVHNGQEIFIAETPEKIANAVMLLLNNPSLRRKVGSAAQEYIQKYHDWNRVYKAFGEMGL